MIVRPRAHTPRVRDDDVFDTVARLAAAGVYRDDILGIAGVDLDGNGVLSAGPKGTLRRMYTRGSHEFRVAAAKGWIDPLPPLQAAPIAAAQEAEQLAGVPLPPLLRRLFLEVGNGGFGPGYGVLGLRGGYEFCGRTALSGLRHRDQWSGKARLFPCCCVTGAAPSPARWTLSTGRSGEATRTRRQTALTGPFRRR